MKNILFFLWALFMGVGCYGQRTVPLRNLWAEPEVHVAFDEFIVSFTIKDIRKAIRLLRESEYQGAIADVQFDSGVQYQVPISAGLNMEYHFPLQALLQQNVACYLLSIGHATVRNTKGKVLTEIVMDIDYSLPGDDIWYVAFYSPAKHEMLFQGKLPVVLYKKDIGIDD